MGMKYFFAASAAWESDPPVLVYADGGPVCKTPVNVRLFLAFCAFSARIEQQSEAYKALFLPKNSPITTDLPPYP
jgi:hypothetical protein